MRQTLRVEFSFWGIFCYRFSSLASPESQNEQWWLPEKLRIHNVFVVSNENVFFHETHFGNMTKHYKKKYYCCLLTLSGFLCRTIATVVNLMITSCPKIPLILRRIYKPQNPGQKISAKISPTIQTATNISQPTGTRLALDRFIFLPRVWAMCCIHVATSKNKRISFMQKVKIKWRYSGFLCEVSAFVKGLVFQDFFWFIWRLNRNLVLCFIKMKRVPQEDILTLLARFFRKIMCVVLATGVRV